MYGKHAGHAKEVNRLMKKKVVGGILTAMMITVMFNGCGN